MNPVLREAERGHTRHAVLKTGGRVERHLAGGAVEEKALGEEMLADDREGHLIVHGFIDWMAKTHADDLRVRFDVQWPKRRLDQSECVVPVVWRKGGSVSVEGEGIGSVHNRIGAARLAIAEAKRVPTPCQVVVDQGSDPTDFSNQRRLIVVDLHRGVKRLFVRHTYFQEAFTLLIAGPQLSVDTLDPSILLQNLEFFLQGCECHRRADAEFQAIVQVGRAEPAVAFHVDPRQFPLDDPYRNYS